MPVNVAYRPLPASFIVNTVPVITALLALIFLKERFRRLAWLGTGVSFAGVVAIASTQPGGIAFGERDAGTRCGNLPSRVLRPATPAPRPIRSRHLRSHRGDLRCRVSCAVATVGTGAGKRCPGIRYPLGCLSWAVPRRHRLRHLERRTSAFRRKPRQPISSTSYRRPRRRWRSASPRNE